MREHHWKWSIRKTFRKLTYRNKEFYAKMVLVRCCRDIHLYEWNNTLLDSWNYNATLLVSPDILFGHHYGTWFNFQSSNWNRRNFGSIYIPRLLLEFRRHARLSCLYNYVNFYLVATYHGFTRKYGSPYITAYF